MDRRIFLGGLLGGLLTACGGDGSDALASEYGDDDGTRGDTSPPRPSGSGKSRVIVVGGGMAGATVAKYLRLWGDGIDVTLVERSAAYTSNILSSLVLTGQRSLSAMLSQADSETMRAQAPNGSA